MNVRRNLDRGRDDKTAKKGDENDIMETWAEDTRDSQQLPVNHSPSSLGCRYWFGVARQTDVTLTEMSPTGTY